MIKLYYATFMILLIILLTSSFNRNIIWQNEITLWNDTALKSPKSLRTLFNQARSYHKKGNLQMAENLYLKTLHLFPENPHILNNLGNIYNEKALYHEAIKYYELSLIYENSPNTHFNLAVALEKTGNIEKAIYHYEEALKVNPTDREAKIRIDKLLSDTRSN